MTATAITREIADAGVGVGRLIRYDPRWPYGFDPTAGGFLRSFLGPLLALPFHLIVAATLSLLPTPGETAATAAAAGGGLDAQELWAQVLAHGLNTLAFPVIVGALARPLGLGEGYTGFIVVVNWASLFLSIALAAVSPLNLLGEVGYSLFGVAWLSLIGISLFVVWRAARETLSTEIPPALLMVVLSVGVAVASDHLAGWMFGVSV